MDLKFLFQRVLLVFLLKELNYSSAFPRGRSSTSPESGQAEKEKQKAGYGYGNRRPLHYIRALRQANATSSTDDQVQAIPLAEIEESPLMLRSFAPIQNQLHPSHPVQNVNQPQPGTKMIQETSPTLSAQQRNQLTLRPRNFEFNLKLPFANFPGQNKEDDSSIKGSSLGSNQKDDQQQYRPTSVQLHSSFNNPSGSVEKGSTKNPNGGKDTHDPTKPSYQFSLSVPIPPPSPSPKPSNDKVVHLGSLLIPEANPQSHSVKDGSGWVLLNSGPAQQPTKHQAYGPMDTQSIDSKLVTFPPGPLSQLSFLTEPSSQSAQQTVQYPQQSELIHGGYYSPQIQPTKNNHGSTQVIQSLSPDSTNVPQFQSQYESLPSGYYSAGQAPSGNYYAQPQTQQSVSHLLTSPPEKYDHSQLQASYSLGQNVQTTSHPSPGNPLPANIGQSHYVPSSGYYGKGNVGQTDSSYQYSSDHSGHKLLPNHPTTNYQSVSTGYQTPMGLPGQQLSGKPSYAKLLINMDDMSDDDSGLYNDFAAQTANYYSGGNTAEPHPNTPAQMPIYSQAPIVDSGAGQYTPHPEVPMETEQAQTFNSPSAYDNYAPAVGVNAGTVQTNFGQQEPSFHPGQDSYYPSHGQYPTDQWQPQYPAQQSNYPVSDDGIQQSSHYTNPLPSVGPYQY
ncbi:uncharacterized protein LOC141796612 [Halichoeres trimaculatus]|uniref:uncharacterized protein LOC141796612 n=1 Tax=Halichoeres trimaculatus TaxID=147232 RepID=UPI003D9E5899